MTIVMEMGLIHPPVGLNLFVIKNIAPDIPLADVIWGVVPFVALMIVAVVVLSLVPDISTWLPHKVMDTGVDWMQVVRVTGYGCALILAAGFLVRFAVKRSAPAR